MSDRFGRRFTLLASAVAGLAGAILLALGNDFATFALAQILMGASMAFASGTDSAMLYESLVAAGRKAEVEQQELRAWRFSFTALALSAITGGAMATLASTAPFYAGAFAFGGVLLLALRFHEPPKSGAPLPEGAEVLRLHALKSALTQPVLIWLFALSVLMYGFSHLPFVFGQPFILAALNDGGHGANAPMVSGAVSAAMMVISVLTSCWALRLRNWLGLPAILMAAFTMQIALIGILALSNTIIVIAIMFLRMVPDSLSKPFIAARVQPELQDTSRATYLSLQSFCARLVFAATLYLASFGTAREGLMPYADIQRILGYYVLGGLAVLIALIIAARRLPIDARRPASSC
ncbi:Major Facilitator Superfamily protein [Roseovarius marisflavi]|uniref:Major Facilitator Superfamily protein n=1 Tax=Roseovarius marisflavi TaxID=1054996 RepID=A0A1M6YAT6_9RHOB|nr:MFS transporter [Roseovarius marisflavi]SHL15387.1 Major Facilitator Superfamily protein [Roseovarius marisflavi]